VAVEQDITEIKTNIGALGTRVETLLPKVETLISKVEATGNNVAVLAKKVKGLQRDKWGIPVVVALITGVVGFFGSRTATWYSVEKQLDSEVRAAIGRLTVTSYQNIRETIVELDSTVQAFCQFPQFTQGEKLIALCRKLQSYAENAPITVPEKTRKDVEDYVDYVAREYTNLKMVDKGEPGMRQFCREAKIKKLALLKEVDAIVQ